MNRGIKVIILLAFLLVGSAFIYWGVNFNRIGAGASGIAFERAESLGSITWTQDMNGVLIGTNFSNPEITSEFEYTINQMNIQNMMIASANMIVMGCGFIGMGVLFWLSGIVAWILMQEEK